MVQVSHLTAQWVERTQTASSLPELRRAILEQLRVLVGCETAYWGELRGAPCNDGHVRLVPDAHASTVIGLFAANHTRYSTPRTVEVIRAVGGVVVDSEIYTLRQRDRLPVYTEIIRPAHISSTLAVDVDFRERAVSTLRLARHGSGVPFGEREKEVLRRVRDALGVMEVAFRASALPQSGQGPASPDDARVFETLSPREAQVARMVARGLQNKEIAALLGTSPDTVRKQTSRVYEKLGVSGRVELAVWFPWRDPAARRGAAREAMGRAPTRRGARVGCRAS